MGKNKQHPWSITKQNRVRVSTSVPSVSVRFYARHLGFPPGVCVVQGPDATFCLQCVAVAFASVSATISNCTKGPRPQADMCPNASHKKICFIGFLANCLPHVSNQV